MIALLDSTLGDAVIYGGGGDVGHDNNDGSNMSSGHAGPRQDGDLLCFGGIVYPSDEFQFWSGYVIVPVIVVVAVADVAIAAVVAIVVAAAHAFALEML